MEQRARRQHTMRQAAQEEEEEDTDPALENKDVISFVRPALAHLGITVNTNAKGKKKGNGWKLELSWRVQRKCPFGNKQKSIKTEPPEPLPRLLPEWTLQGAQVAIPRPAAPIVDAKARPAAGTSILHLDHVWRGEMSDLYLCESVKSPLHL